MFTTKKEAEKIIKNVRLLERLSAYGRAELVGSIALDLLAKPEIEIHLLINTSDPVTVAAELVRQFLSETSFDQIKLFYNRKLQGIKLIVDNYIGTFETWSLDILITADPDYVAFDAIPEMRAQLDDEKRAIIMSLKRYYHAKKTLYSGLGNKIYRAVVFHGVRKIDELEAFLKSPEGQE